MSLLLHIFSIYHNMDKKVKRFGGSTGEWSGVRVLGSDCLVVCAHLHSLVY